MTELIAGADYMILTRLVLVNFGLYAGYQEIALAPVSKKKPVILIGGLNGSGKTSILEAIQLALYGQRAHMFHDGGIKYKEYLKSAVYAGEIIGKTSGVTLEFKIKNRNGYTLYEINRHWELSPKGAINESLSVNVNGKLDTLSTDLWYELVEHILPSRIAPLFFFDGEQVERYAKAGNASIVLQTGLNALLNIDLIDHVCTDIATLRRQQRKHLQNDENRTYFDEAQSELKRLEDEKSQLVQELASTNNTRLMLAKELNALQIELDEQGGDLFEKKESILSMKNQYETDITIIESELRTLASEDLPLCLIKPLLKQIQSQSEREIKAIQSQSLLAVLQERDSDILKLVDSHGPEHLGIHLRNFIAKDVENRVRDCEIECYLNISASAFSALNTFLDHSINDIEEKLNEKLITLQSASSYLTNCNRKLEQTPDEDIVAENIQKRNTTANKIKELDGHFVKISEKISTCEFHINRAKIRIDKLLHERLADDMNGLGAKRIVKYSSIIQEKLSEFKERLTASYISDIELKILECFKSLCRKDTFITSLKIDQKTLSIELCNGNGRIVSTEKLSAGERQLLVISILWGLAKASGRNIPLIVDTPLARLDSHHRHKLVNNYFVEASHQVILLSTDEEINQNWFTTINPYISRSYLLSHNNDTLSTTVSSGYFWN